MANQILSDIGLYVGRYNLSCDAASLTLRLTADVLDDTGLCDVARRRMGGLLDFAFQAEGFWNDEADAPLFNAIALDSTPVSIAPAGRTVGSPAYLMRCNLADYSPVGGGVGEMARFSAGGQGTGIACAKGEVLLNATVGATGNGTARQLGALAAGQSLYATMHVIAATGTTPAITVKIQSDDASGFSTPTDRITFTATSGTWAATPANFDQFGSVAGAVTDTWWRVQYTITGTTPSFGLVVAAGIR